MVSVYKHSAEGHLPEGVEDKYNLIDKGVIPIEKYWNTRLAFLDTIHGTDTIISQLWEEIPDCMALGNDLEAIREIAGEWQEKDTHDVGEGGFVYRLLQFANWKYDLGKTLIKRGTLIDRKMADEPDIVNWSIEDLLTLDHSTTQWASAALLTESQTEAPDDFFLNLSLEAISHYKECVAEGKPAQWRYDATLLKQATAFIDYLRTGETDFQPEQPDDYCFARMMDITSGSEARMRWPELQGHESNRITGMEEALLKYRKGLHIESKDHRVVQAIAMKSSIESNKARYKHSNCVSKSWPTFWNFMRQVPELLLD